MAKLGRTNLGLGSDFLGADDATKLEILNRRFQIIERHLNALAGHEGEIHLNAPINMGGHRVKNIGSVKDSADAISARQTTDVISTAQQLNKLNLDVTKLDESSGLFDADVPSGVQSLALVWKKKSGWLARWTPPTNIVKVFGYFVSFFNDASGVKWMNAETGQIVADQATAEKFVETDHFRTSVGTPDLVSPFSTTGVKVRVVAQVKIKGLGKVRGMTVDYPTLVGPGTDSNIEDPGAASAPVNLTLVWGAKKKGFKGTWQVPTTNNLSIQGYYCVFMDNAGANFMNAETGALASPNTEAGAKVFVTDTRITTGLEASQLASQFAGGVKLKVWAVNRVAGVLTDGTPATSAFVAPNGEDAGPPSAVQSLTLVWGAKKKGFKATWDRPATNNNSIIGYKVVYMDNAAANFMVAETGALAANESAATIFVTDTRHTTGLEASQLASQFVAGVKVKVTAVNLIGGVQTDGTPATSAFVAPSGEDTGPASVVQNVQFFWSGKKGWKVVFERPATNYLSIQGYKLVFFDNGATHYMNATTGQINAPDTENGATIFIVDTVFATLLKYGDLDAAFQAGVKVKITPINLIQGVETPGTSYTSSLVPPVNDDSAAAIDFIGTGVPVQAMGLQAFSTAPGSPAVANDTTHYSIDPADTTDYQAMITAGTVLHLYIASLTAANTVRKTTAYDTVNHRFTVDVAFGSTPGNTLAYQIHFGNTIGGKSGSGHGTTSFILDHAIDGSVSTVNDFYRGMMIWIPSATAGQQIQRITTSSYNGGTQLHTLTMEAGAGEVALGGAPANNAAYLLANGAFGYENNDQTGKIAAVPLRMWLNTDTAMNIGEAIPPLDFNLTQFQWQAIRKSNGQIRATDKPAATTSPTFEFNALGYLPMVRIRWRNQYRKSASDGWGTWSYHVAAYLSTDTPTGYAPTSFTQPDVDFQGKYPAGWLLV